MLENIKRDGSVSPQSVNKGYDLKEMWLIRLVAWKELKC